eukprot:TRINITY_DN2690_c0_g1_i1.p1 TRINITY_DN2690_c0_g1~~TRINITY_DN2690_c0_g1_i1.p1  ORF type:complete len:297 (+),score=55.59 TRINITY_DN2690_c0_g1_i1:123-1013(+)
MATCSLGGALNFKLSNIYSVFAKTQYGRLETLYGIRTISIGQKPVHFAGLVQSQRYANPSTVSCVPSSGTVNNLEDGSQEENPISRTSYTTPNSFEAGFRCQTPQFPITSLTRVVKVESLLTEICDTTSIAEFELKLDGFRLYVSRDLGEKTKPPSPPSFPPVNTNIAVETSDLNGSVSTPSLAISKSKPSLGGIQRLLDTATDEGLVILQSPKVGYFRRSRTIKGKRAPPSCKEKQIVKEGQVLCYVEQLGGEIPIESDVSGEIIKILRKDGEPVGYGDALIAILPSFPGIKKLH